MSADIATDVQSIRCLLLPLKGINLIVPHSSVDEILPFAVVEDQTEQELVVGKILWRRDTIPLISFEILNKQEKPEVRRRTRAAVLHTNNEYAEIQNFALILSGMPKMIVVSETDISDLEGELPNCTLKRVMVSGTDAYIPDIDALEYILKKKYQTDQ